MKYRLGHICSITKGATGIMKAIPGPYTMIALGETDKTHNEFQFDAKAVIIPLVSSTGHGHASMKRVKYCEGKFALGNILCAVIPNDENFVLAKYLHIYLHWNREELLVSQMKGMANVSLPMNRIADVMVTVPNIEKQREIIELEKQLVDKEIEADKLFADQLTQLDNLNQAILKEAVQGKLVPQDPNDEPASELLKRIKSEKANLRQAQGKGKKEKPLPPIKPEEIPFEIPETWVWCKLGGICEINGGYAFKSTDYTKDGIRVIRISDFDKNGFINDSIVRHNYNEKLKSFLLDKENILLAMTGGTVGKSYFVENLPEPLVVNQRVATIKILGDLIIPKFIDVVVKSSITQRIIHERKNSTNDNISMDDIRSFLIPLPPLSEQKRIVAEIEKQFAKTKQLKEHILANQLATEQLLKALLHQAFEVKEMEIV